MGVRWLGGHRHTPVPYRHGQPGSRYKPSRVVPMVDMSEPSPFADSMDRPTRVEAGRTTASSTGAGNVLTADGNPPEPDLTRGD